MANNNDLHKKIAQARELLSPYLDGEVSAAERALVEEALAADAGLRAELDSLQTTVNWLHDLPAAVPPRPFTISEADVPGKTTSPRRSWLMPDWLKLWGTAAVGMLCILAVGGVLFMQQMRGGMLSAPAADVAMLEEAAQPQAIEPDMEKAVEMPATIEPSPQPPAVTAEVQAAVVEEESMAEEAVELGAIDTEAEDETAPADTNQLAPAAPPADDTMAAAETVEHGREPAPAEKAAPVLEGAAESPANESLEMERSAEIPQADDAASAPTGEAMPEPSSPPPEAELLAAPPSDEEAAPLMEDSAVESIETEESTEAESRAAVSTPTVTVAATPSPAPSMSPLPPALTPTAAPVATVPARKTTTLIIIFVGVLLLIGVSGVLWYFWRKQRR